MHYKIEDIEVGDMVTIRSAFGSGPLHVGIVENTSDNIKNGFPGIDYKRTDNGDIHWAYVDQVIRVDAK